jgi:hypothetical protein
VCDGMILAAAEVGHVTGARFLQIVVDEGIRPVLAVKLREKLRITSVVPPRRVCCVGLLLRQCGCGCGCGERSTMCRGGS